MSPTPESVVRAQLAELYKYVEQRTNTGTGRSIEAEFVQFRGELKILHEARAEALDWIKWGKRTVAACVLTIIGALVVAWLKAKGG